MTNETIIALNGLLEYAKYLEDNNQLKYEHLKARVESVLGDE